jgi:signal transduction histidine kinase
MFDDVRRRAASSTAQVVGFIGQRIDDRMPAQPPTDPQEIKTLWTNIIETDEEIPRFLENTALDSQIFVEILVVGDGGRILADSLPSRAGQRARTLPTLGEWAAASPLRRTWELWTRSAQEYEASTSFGAPQPRVRVFWVKVVLSPTFLRHEVSRTIINIALVCLGALLLSMALSVVVSNLALRPLASISQTIDRISRGEIGKEPPASERAAKEFAAVQSKLNLLGQQYHGARQDALQLRTNVEQLLERLEEVVFLFDGDDRLVMAGRAAERLLGRPRWELMGRSLGELFPTSTALGTAVRNALGLRQPLKDLPVTLEREGGGTRLLVNVEPLEAFPERQRIGTLITLRDAETRREIRSHLDVSVRLAAISRLTGGVAHEIKNPLQAITVHLELLRSRLAAEGDSPAPEIDTIAREIQRLDRVVKTFLDFTRPVDLKVAEIEMAGLAREVATLVRPSAQRQNVQIAVRAEPQEVHVQGDRDLLQQAVLNVVVNGIEAMKNGGRLDIAVEKSGDECILSVADQGGGIPLDIRDKIFNLYYSTKGKGSGIGLAMTFRVVQLHNGTIDFSSEVGLGTTFRLRFPVTESESPRRAATAGGDRPGQ